MTTKRYTLEITEDENGTVFNRSHHGFTPIELIGLLHYEVDRRTKKMMDGCKAIVEPENERS